jgi:thioesterase domain-containing protein
LAITPQALQEYFHEHIPLSKAIGVKVEVSSPHLVRLAAPLAPNTNHHGTVFGGSASAVAVLAAWGLLHVAMEDAGIKADLVVQKSGMSYALPITGEFTAEAAAPAPEKWQRFVAMLLKYKRARISIASILNCGDQRVGEFEGDFVAVIH